MGEQESGIQPPAPPGEAEQKPVVFAVRIDPTLREQIEGLRGITGQTVNQVGEEALRGWIDGKLADEEVRTRAMAGIEEEERRLAERRAAIAKVLGTTAGTSGDGEPESGGGPGRGRSARKAKE